MIPETSERVVNIFMTVLLLLVSITNGWMTFHVQSIAQAFIYGMSTVAFGLSAGIFLRMEVLNFIEKRKAASK